MSKPKPPPKENKRPTKKSKKAQIEKIDEQEDEECIKLDPNQCSIQTPNKEVKQIERNFWGKYEIQQSHFFGGTLGKEKGGIISSVISNDSRLIAYGLTTGFVVVYDMTNVEPKLIRMVKTKSPAKDL
jgi:hypothetical protein